MLFAEAIRMTLVDLGMSVAGVVSTGEDAVTEVRRSRPDVILMDMSLPDQSGLAAGQVILKEWPDSKILALTAMNDPAVAQEAIRLGFRGYLTKDASVTQFVNSVRSVIDGHLVVPHRLGAAARGEQEDHAALLAAQLTPRERQVLALLVEGADGRSVAKRLGISRNTVRTHVQSILSKLQVHSRLEAATFAVRHRLVDIPIAGRGGRSASVDLDAAV
jgi:DNA-binding NarL/FixJ family response regulator